MPASLVWFRKDLRLADHPALIAGLGSGRPVVLVYEFDPAGDHVRRSVPALASLPPKIVHRPCEADSPLALEIYPARTVEHDIARDRALQAFRALKRSA